MKSAKELPPLLVFNNSRITAFNHMEICSDRAFSKNLSGPPIDIDEYATVIMVSYRPYY